MKSLNDNVKIQDVLPKEKICAPEKTWFARWLHLIGNKLNLSQWSYLK